MVTNKYHVRIYELAYERRLLVTRTFKTLVCLQIKLTLE